MKTLALALGLSAVLGIFGCGDDEEGGSTAAGGTESVAGHSNGDGGSAAGDGGSTSSGMGGGSSGPCADSADCAGRTCCTTGNGGPSCVDAPEDCMGLVLCSLPSECAYGEPCCPQGFCGGCD